MQGYVCLIRGKNEFGNFNVCQTFVINVLSHKIMIICKLLEVQFVGVNLIGYKIFIPLIFPFAYVALFLNLMFCNINLSI